MKELLKKNWEYILYKKNNNLILSVVCGTIALYDIEIILNSEEKERYLQEGEKYIDILASQIRDNPSSWNDRNIG